MAQIDNAVEALQLVAQSVERASEEPDGSDRERYWHELAQIQTTVAIATALIAIHEAIQTATRRMAGATGR